jgi:CHRD domain-containing protein
MRSTFLRLMSAVVFAGAVGVPAIGMAGQENDQETIQAKGTGYQIVPSQNSPGTSTLNATVDRVAQTITYTLHYEGLKGDIIQSHIHFGQRATNGDIVVFLCTNNNNGPVGTPTCDGPREGTVTRTAGVGDIVALPFGGIQPAQQLLPFGPGSVPGNTATAFEELADAIDAGATYTVVHTQAQPSGEVRGQIQGEESENESGHGSGHGSSGHGH